MERASHKPRSELGSGLRNLVVDSGRVGAGSVAGHRTAAHERRARSTGDQPDGLHEPEAHRARIGEFHDLIIDAYGEPGENYPISMENRAGRMKRIETQHVLEKVARAGESDTRGVRE